MPAWQPRGIRQEGRQVRRKQDMKEQFLNSLSGVGVVLLSSLVFILLLYAVTILVRTFFALGTL